MKKRKVILVTDGDQHVQRALEKLAKQLGARCISQSQGNPSRLTGKQIVDLILQTPYDPVFVMFDDGGIIGEGAGEQALRYVATHEQIDVLGAVAVASDTNNQEWTKVDICVDYDGNLTTYGVDKEGIPEWEFGRVNGDTVYCLDQLSIPIVVGVGDIGKMRRRDDIRSGCRITRKAIEYILERSKRDENKKLHADFSEAE